MANKNDQNTFQDFSTNVKDGLKDVNHLPGTIYNDMLF